MGIRIIFLFLFSLVSYFSFGQLIQKNNTYGMSFNRTGADTLLFFPRDTFPVPTIYRSYAHTARKGDSLYIWSPNLLRWSLYQSGNGSTPFVQCGLTCDDCGIVTWTGTGLVFNASPASYNINNTAYTFNGGDVTLNAADPTFARFDAIVLTALGISKVTGTAAADPQLPQFDPCENILLTYVFVDINATTPTIISDEVIYDEDVETWSHSTNGTITANFASSAFAFHLTKSTLVSTQANNANIIYTSPTALGVGDYTTFSFYLRLTAAMTSGQNISVQFFNGTTAVSNQVVGLIAKSTVNAWQPVVFSMSQFNFTSTTFTNIRLIFSGSNVNARYIDWIRLQGGVVQPPAGVVYSANLPVRISGLVISADTSVAFSPSLTTNARLIKVADSIISLGGGNQKFGHASGDYRATEDRYFSANQNGFTIDSIGAYRVYFDNSQGLLYQDWNTYTDRFRLNSSLSAIYSPNAENYISVDNNGITISKAAGDNLTLPNIAYNSGSPLVALQIDTLTGRVYRKTAASASTPTLQQVVAAGNTLVNNSIAFSNSGGRGYIQWDADGSGTPIAQFDGGEYSMKFYNESNNRGIEFDWTDLSNSTKVIKFPNFTSNDYFAIAGYANSWGDGVKQTFNPNGTNAGINVGSHTAAPSSLANGDLWYNSTSNELNARINGATVALGAGGGGVSAADLPLRISGGTTVSADTSVAYNPSVTTNQRLQKIIDSLSGAGWGNNLYTEPWYQVFEHIRQTDRGSFDYGSSGTGSSTTVEIISAGTFDGWVGRLSLSTGTTTTGYAQMGYQRSGNLEPVVMASTIRMNVGFKVRLEDLSDGTDTYTLMSGLMDITSLESSIVDGVWFSYTHGASSGQWVCNTRSNSVSTTSASGVTVAVDTDYTLEISVYNTEAKFYIQTGTGAKTLVATIATNIPYGSSRITGINTSMIKSAGTTARLAYIDWGAYGSRSN